MRPGVDTAKLRRFMEAMGKASTGPGRIYLVGGSTALLLGIRDQTIDIDLKLEPEPKGAFEAIASLKEQLSLNVELASPDMFLPSLPGWEDRSEFILRVGEVDFYHYDFYAQAMSKLLRGHSTDVADAKALVRLGKVNPTKLVEHFLVVREQMIRYPAVNVVEFEARVREFADGCQQ